MHFYFHQVQIYILYILIQNLHVFKYDLIHSKVSDFIFPEPPVDSLTSAAGIMILPEVSCDGGHTLQPDVAADTLNASPKRGFTKSRLLSFHVK